MPDTSTITFHRQYEIFQKKNELLMNLKNIKETLYWTLWKCLNTGKYSGLPYFII